VAFKGRGLNCRGPGMKCALKKNKNGCQISILRTPAAWMYQRAGPLCLGTKAV
jgi:hypothetical protein